MLLRSGGAGSAATTYTGFAISCARDMWDRSVSAAAAPSGRAVLREACGAAAAASAYRALRDDDGSTGGYAAAAYC